MSFNVGDSDSRDTEIGPMEILKENKEKKTEDPTSPLDINDLFRKRIELLRQIIEEINAEIRDRKLLRNGALKEIEIELNELSVLLNDITPMGSVDVSGDHQNNLNMRRIHLEKSIARLNELRRSHKIDTWRDIVNLKRELFKLLPEYSQLLHLKKVIE